MTLEQFKFKPTLEVGFTEIAEQTIGKNSKVTLKKRGNFVTVIKTLHNNQVYNVSFNDEDKLRKALKNIGKRK